MPYAIRYTERSGAECWQAAGSPLPRSAGFRWEVATWPTAALAASWLQSCGYDAGRTYPIGWGEWRCQVVPVDLAALPKQFACHLFRAPGTIDPAAPPGPAEFPSRRKRRKGRVAPVADPDRPGPMPGQQVFRWED
jgi:hypothetical protein